MTPPSILSTMILTNSLCEEGVVGGCVVVFGERPDAGEGVLPSTWTAHAVGQKDNGQHKDKITNPKIVNRNMLSP